MWPTIIALVVLLGIIGVVVAVMIVNKAKGKTSCSCGCGGCAMRDMCHSNKSGEAQNSGADADEANGETENSEPAKAEENISKS